MSAIFDNLINQDKLVSESSVFPDPGYCEAKMRFESKYFFSFWGLVHVA